MSNVATAVSYKELQNKIKLHLAQAVEMDRISHEDLLGVLFLLGQTSTLLELETFVEIFADAYPVLKTVEIEKRSLAKGNVEEKVRKVVSQLVFTNPKRATEITKAALDKNVSWDELVKNFPELGEV